MITPRWIRAVALVVAGVTTVLLLESVAWLAAPTTDTTLQMAHAARQAPSR